MHLNLNSPSVREEPGFYTPFAWPSGEFHPLPAIETRDDLGFLNLLDRRRTKRTFAALSAELLSQLLWRTARTQGIAESSYGFDLEQRPTPSAGAIHPIHLLIHRPCVDEWGRYDGRQHGLINVPGTAKLFHELVEQCDRTLFAAEATRVLLVAEPGKTSAKYYDGESLIWRDAGALLAVMALVSEALGCTFCPLGITGEPWAGHVAPAGILAGVGMALVGGPA